MPALCSFPAPCCPAPLPLACLLQAGAEWHLPQSSAAFQAGRSRPCHLSQPALSSGAVMWPEGRSPSCRDQLASRSLSPAVPEQKVCAKRLVESCASIPRGKPEVKELRDNGTLVTESHARHQPSCWWQHSALAGSLVAILWEAGDSWSCEDWQAPCLP